MKEATCNHSAFYMQLNIIGKCFNALSLVVSLIFTPVYISLSFSLSCITAVRADKSLSRHSAQVFWANGASKDS